MRKSLLLVALVLILSLAKAGFAAPSAPSPAPARVQPARVPARLPDRVPQKPPPYNPQPIQLPSPPPIMPEHMPRRPRVFDPEQTREASPLPPIQLTPPASPPEAPDHPISVLDAVNLALRLQPDVQVARAELLQATRTTQGRRSLLLPTVSVENQFTHRSASSLTGNTTLDTLNNNVGVSQLLFDFGHSRALVRAAALRQKAAGSHVLQSENDVALAVKESYYTVVQAERLTRVVENDLANRQEQLRLARALYHAGNMSPGDVVRAQTSVSNSVFALNNARRNLDLARQDLAQVMGLPPLTPLALVDKGEPEVAHKDVAYLMLRAAEKRPDLIVAQRNVDASLAGLDAAQTTNYPSLTSFAGLGYIGAINGIQYPTVTLQLTLGFDLYDGGVRAGATKVAAGVLEADRAVLRRTQLAVEREVAGVLVQLLTAERNVAAAKAAVDSAREGVRIAAGRYQAALGSLTDVLDTQSALVTAQVAQVNSHNDLSVARARLRHSMAVPFGEIDPNAPPEPDIRLRPVRPVSPH